MIDLGTVKPGSTIRIPFSSFNSDGASVTISDFAAADILIYKDGSLTKRASAAGITVTTDWDSKTGRHFIVIDLADNTTAEFYAAGSEYNVMVDSITVDLQTAGLWAARFRIGYEGAILDTTIATLSSQTGFTLAAGPADNNALVGCRALIHDAASGVQIALGTVSAYTGSSKTVALAADPAIFTMAAKDNISFFPPANANLIAVNNNTGGVAGFERATRCISTGTVGTGSTTTSIVTSSVSPVGANSDQFKGQIVCFDKDTTTTALRGQKTNITASSNAAAPVLTVSTLSDAPVSGDTFTIQ